MGGSPFVFFTGTGDFNNDGKLDLVRESCTLHIFPFQGPGSCDDSLWLGNGDGTFQPPVALDQSVRGMADFDGDGKLDLATIAGTNAGGVEVQISGGNGDGTFHQPTAVGASSNEVRFALVADINGDHAPDLMFFDFVSIGSNSISVMLNTGTDFSISASQPSSVTLTGGQSATSTLTLSLLSNFNNPVSLTCSVQPVQAGSPACSFNPNSVAFDASGKGTAQLIISAGTSAASAMGSTASAGSVEARLLWLPLVAIAVTGSWLNGISSKRRLMGLLLSGLVFTGLLVQIACGGGSDIGGPKSQNYTVTVTGTSAPTEHSTTLQVKVQ